MLAKLSFLKTTGKDDFMTIDYSKYSLPSEPYDNQAGPVFCHQRLENK
jgi:hypothetical protein